MILTYKTRTSQQKKITIHNGKRIHKNINTKTILYQEKRYKRRFELKDCGGKGKTSYGI